MASLYISEYANMPQQSGVLFQCGEEPVLANQKIAIGATTTSSQFNANTRFVRLHCDAICSVKFGAVATVTAAATDARLAANQTEFFGVNQKAGVTAVAVITNS